MKNLLALIVVLISIISCRANGNKQSEIKIDEISEEKPYVESVDSFPRFWENYADHVDKLNKKDYKAIVKGKTPVQFLNDVIKLNTFNPNTEIKMVEIDGGYYYSKEHSFYYTTTKKGKIISIFIEGEEEGKLPSYSEYQFSDDFLCFFGGKKEGKCATADDT